MSSSSSEDIDIIGTYKEEKNNYPRLVLSIVGDSGSFVPRPWLTSVFQLGLIETAKGAKDCLILYKGSKEKISCLVREAVNNFKVLDNEEKKADKATISLVGISYQEKEQKEPEEDKCLTLGDKGYDDILSEISKEYVPFVELGEGNKLKMPVLVIVAEGDSYTIELIQKILEKNIPILVLKGSGKAADLIAGCLNDEHSVQVEGPILFGTYFNQKRLGEIDNCIDIIKEKKQLVNILDINKHDESHFPDAVSNAIIRAWAQSGIEENERPVKSAMSRQSPVVQVSSKILDQTISYKDMYTDTENVGVPALVTPNVAKNSNTIPNSSLRLRTSSVHPSSVTLHNARVEGEVKEFMEEYQKSLSPASLPLYFYIAYQFIQEMPHEKDKCQNFQILLKQAIVADRVDYVTVLLQEEQVQFNREHFPYIYNKVLKCECVKTQNTGDCQHMWAILQSASADSTDNLFKDKDYQDRMKAGRQLCQKFLHYSRKSYKKSDFEEDKIDGRALYHDLLIWAIFCNRKELATLFWSKCPNQLETAVLVCCILKRMASKARSGKDQFLYTSLLEHSEVFAQRSLELQSIIYEEDPEVAMDMIMAECTVLDIQINPLECAYDNDMLDFIAHSCSQRRLNKIWYKQIGSTLGDFWWNGFFCGCKKKGKKDNKSRMLFRFFQAPLTRFLVHYLLFIAALVCYSAFLLIELSEYKDLKSIKIYEWLMYGWLVGDIVEEYRGLMPWNNEKIKNRFSRTENKAMSQSTWHRFKKYLYDFWNALDVFSYNITIAAVLVRFLKKSSYGSSGTDSYNYSDDPKLARRLYSLSLFTMYMRFLHAILMSRKLGPKIIMIKEMLKDLFRFIGILFVFMVGVGVLYHANMYPAHYDMWNSNDWTYWRIWKIMYIPYWQIYGELFLEEFKANSSTPCTTNQSQWEGDPGNVERCNEYDWVLIVIAALYLLISNLLLVNLVIALFSYRFEIVQANSEKLWRFWRYAVIMDYRTRVPAPLNLVIRPFMFMFNCMKRCYNKCCKKKYEIDKGELKRMEILQDISANKCIRSERIT